MWLARVALTDSNPSRKSQVLRMGVPQGSHKKFSQVAGLGVLVLERCQMQGK